MREWKMRYGQKCKGGKCRSGQLVQKAEPISYIERPLSYFLKLVLRLLSEQRVILVHYKNSGGLCFVQFQFARGSIRDVMQDIAYIVNTNYIPGLKDT